MSFQKPAQPAPPPTSAQPATRSVGEIVAAVRGQFERDGVDMDIANAFVRDICAKQSRWERPRLVALVGKQRDADDSTTGGNRWEWPYEDRVLQQARYWASLNPDERAVIAAHTTEDGIPWRGEPIEHYCVVVDETLRMRDIGRKAYLTECKQAWAELEARQNRKPRHGRTRNSP